MNILCKTLGHDFNFETFGFLICTRCGKSLDIRWAKAERDKRN